jgi:hypothetical protein
MQRGVIPRWQYLLVYVMIVGAGVLGFLRTEDATDQARRAARQASELARDIQAQRVKTVRNNCEEQNNRHSEADATLRELIRQGRRDDEDGTKLLIDAITPFRDCDRAVREATRSP